MLVIEAANAHCALPLALHHLYSRGVKEDSRNGPVLRMPTPVTTVYHKPQQRLVFHDWRDSNPFFLHVEALWMLAGREDLKPLTKYVKRMADFSDDGGVTSPGAYGKRWRSWQPDLVNLPEIETYWPDQLNWVVQRLRSNPSDRRAVISMWDPAIDPERADMGGKDVPCNLMILPWIESSALHLTVFNRSNDIIWGLYSANAVQFSTLLDYLAARIGVSVGTLTTVSNNFHAYEATLPVARGTAVSPKRLDPYDAYYQEERCLLPTCLGWNWIGTDACAERTFQEDLAMLFEYKPTETQIKARSAYIRQVTCPLMIAHDHYAKTTGEDRYDGALEILRQIPNNLDYRAAAEQWVIRRKRTWLAKLEKPGAME